MKKQLNERILSKQTNDSLWFAGISGNNVQSGKYSYQKSIKDDNRKNLLNASIQNPIFFSRNIEYAYSYAKCYAETDGNGGYVAALKIQSNLNLLDLTDPKEVASLFPDCANSPNFYELFKNAEPYFGFNEHSLPMAKQNLRPISFIIARLFLTHVFQKQLGIDFKQMYQQFALDDSNNFVVDEIKDRATNQLINCYRRVSKKYQLKIHQIIMNDKLKDEVLNRVKFTKQSYTKMYNDYVKAAFGPSVKPDSVGKYMSDNNEKQVKLTTYRERAQKGDRHNMDRPVTFDPNVMASKDATSNKYTSQIFGSAILPAELTDDQIRHVNAYLDLTEELHKWWKNAVLDISPEEKSLNKKLEIISSIVNNNDSDDSTFTPGKASKYIDELQYMLFYLIAKNANNYDGCYAPEVIAAQDSGRKIDSIDETIFIWNTKNVAYKEIIDYRKFTPVIRDISKSSNTKSNLDMYGKKYDDNILTTIIDIAKGTKIKGVNKIDQNKMLTSITKKILSIARGSDTPTLKIKKLTNLKTSINSNKEKYPHYIRNIAFKRIDYAINNEVHYDSTINELRDIFMSDSLPNDKIKKLTDIREKWKVRLSMWNNGIPNDDNENVRTYKNMPIDRKSYNKAVQRVNIISILRNALELEARITKVFDNVKETKTMTDSLLNKVNDTINNIKETIASDEFNQQLILTADVDQSFVESYRKKLIELCDKCEQQALSKIDNDYDNRLQSMKSLTSIIDNILNDNDLSIQEKYYVLNTIVRPRYGIRVKYLRDKPNSDKNELQIITDLYEYCKLKMRELSAEMKARNIKKQIANANTPGIEKYKKFKCKIK